MEYDQFEENVNDNICEENQVDVDKIIRVDQLSIEEDVSICLNPVQCDVYNHENQLIFYVFVCD